MERVKHLIYGFALILLLGCPGIAWSAGTVTLSSTTNVDSGKIRTVTLAWVGDASNGTCPATSTDSLTVTGRASQSVTQWINGYYLCYATVNPGSTAPTADYDIAITDSGGASVFNGSLDDLSATVTQTRVPYVDSNQTSIGCVPVTGALTVSWSNNSVASNTGTIELKFIKGD